MKDIKVIIKFLNDSKLFRPFDLIILKNILDSSVFSCDPHVTDLIRISSRYTTNGVKINPIANFINALKTFKSKKENKEEILKYAKDVDNIFKIQNISEKSIYNLLCKDEIDEAITILKQVIKKERKTINLHSASTSHYINRIEPGTHKGRDLNDIKKIFLFKLLELYCESKKFTKENYYEISILIYCLCFKDEINNIIKKENNIIEEKYEELLNDLIKDTNVNSYTFLDNIRDNIEYIERLDEFDHLASLYKDIEHESEIEFLSEKKILFSKWIREKIEETVRKGFRIDLEKKGIFILGQKEILKIQNKREEIFKEKSDSIRKEYEVGKINEQDYNLLIKRYEYIIKNTFFTFIHKRLPDNIKNLMKQQTKLNEEIINEISCYEQIINNLNNRYYLTYIEFEPKDKYNEKENGAIQGFKKGGMSPESLCRILVLADLTKFNIPAPD